MLFWVQTDILTNIQLPLLVYRIEIAYALLHFQLIAAIFASNASRDRTARTDNSRMELDADNAGNVNGVRK